MQSYKKNTLVLVADLGLSCQLGEYMEPDSELCATTQSMQLGDTPAGTQKTGKDLQGAGRNASSLAFDFVDV